jgi:hypothetical protein
MITNKYLNIFFIKLRMLFIFYIGLMDFFGFDGMEISGNVEGNYLEMMGCICLGLTFFELG